MGEMSTAKLAVILVIAGAVAFGLFIGYLAYANDSFPSQTKPFADYAQVESTTFNGTEIAFNVIWQNSSGLPLYAQLTSPSSDAANTPVCDVGLSSVSSGQSIFMPFAISPTSATLSNVYLSVAVRPLTSGSDFTIVYQLQTIAATNAAITPSNISCQQQGAIE